MPVNSYHVGQEFRLTVEFKDENDVLTAPTDPTIKYKDPADVITTKATGDLTNPSTGVYYVDVTLDQHGIWWMRGFATSGLIAAIENNLKVIDSRFD